jgi:hypothetical protein
MVPCGQAVGLRPTVRTAASQRGEKLVTANGQGGSFWTTFPGILTGVAGLITAVAGLLVALNQTGVIGDQESTPPTQSTATESSTAGSNPGEGADAIAGRWTGKVRYNGNVYSIDLYVDAPCRLHSPCGTIHLSLEPCTGRIKLVSVESKTYEFSVDNFTADSGSGCKPGRGDFFTLLDDGSLRWTPSYLPEVESILHKKR